MTIGYIQGDNVTDGQAKICTAGVTDGQGF